MNMQVKDNYDRLRERTKVPMNGNCYVCKEGAILYPVVKRDRKTWQGVCRRCFERIGNKTEVEA